MATEEKTQSYNLFKMSKEDVEQVAAIEATCFSNPWPKEIFRYEILNPSVFTLVAKEKTFVLGYLVGYPRGAEFHIANIAIRPEYRRRGIGRELLMKALSSARELGCRFAILDVRPSNESAIGLYNQLGFHLVGRRTGYYTAPPEDAWVMRKELTIET